MQNYSQPGEVVTLTAAASVVSGTAYKTGSLIAVACVSASTGESYSAAVTGVFTLPKATGQTWSEGSKLYWDDSGKKFTTSSGGNTLAGVALAAAGSSDTTGLVRLDGVAR